MSTTDRSFTRHLRLAGIAAVVTLAVCTSDPATDAAPLVVRDSAGIEIVESGRPTWRTDDGWRIASATRLRSGDETGATGEPFYRITDLARALDGRVLVAQRDGILLMSADGAKVERIARAGEGPGEFVALSSAQVCADTVVATDYMRAGLTRLTLDGMLVRTRALPRPQRSGRSSWRVLSCDGRDVYVIGSGPRDDDDAQRSAGIAGRRITRDSLVVVRVDGQGSAMDTVLTVAGAQSFDGLVVPFGRSTFVAVHDGRVHVVDNGRPEIRVYTANGALLRIIRLVGLNPAPVDDADIERRRAEYADGVPPGLYARDIGPRLDAVAIPATMPFFSDLAISDDGTIWLRRYQPFRSTPVNGWIVVSARGEWLGDVRIPDRFRPFRFSADAVLGVWRDEMDIEYVHEYAIERQDVAR